MKNKILVWFFLCLFLNIQIVAHAESFYPQADKELLQNGIWTKIDFEKDSSVAVVSVRVLYRYPIHQVFEELVNTNQLKKIHDSFLASQTLSLKTFAKIQKANPKESSQIQTLVANEKSASNLYRKKGQKWMEYLYLNVDLPWPIANRWMVQKANVDESQAKDGYYKYAYQMLYGNFKILKGYWELVKVPNHPNWTEFRGRYRTDPNIPVPKFIAKKAVKTGFKQDVAENKKHFKNKFKK